MEWYIIRKKGTKRWIAYQLTDTPTLKRGYEFRGPFPNIVMAIMEVNNTK